MHQASLNNLKLDVNGHFFVLTYQTAYKPLYTVAQIALFSITAHTLPSALERSFSTAAVLAPTMA